jgi:propanediol dehydratase small subunit
MPAEYPLFETSPSRLRTPTGLPFEEITLDAVLEGRIGMQDLRVTREALELQAGIAERAGRPQLAENFRRAAELVEVPEAEVLDLYTMLRPGRAGKRELLEKAAGLESRYGAHRCAALFREAAEAYGAAGAG